MGWLTPRSGRFNHGEDPVLTVQEDEWALGSLWTGAESLAPTWVRSLDLPARREALYRLSYPGPRAFKEQR
jgi:hypothetical protein